MSLKIFQTATIFSILLPTIAFAEPDGYTYEDMWVWAALSNNQAYWDEEADGLCKKLHVGHDDWHYSWPSYDTNEQTNTHSRECIDTQGDNTDIRLECKRGTFDPISGDFVFDTRFRIGGPCPRPKNNTLECTSGNPIENNGGAKVETAVDWFAPNEPRFKIERSYRSDFDHVTAHDRLSYYAHGGLWRQNFSEALDNRKVPDTSAIVWSKSDGSKIYFNEVPDGTSLREGDKWLLKANTFHTRKIVDGTGFERIFWRFAKTLIGFQWSDGYKITIVRPNRGSAQAHRNGEIGEIYDNKGNKVIYNWSNTVVSNYPRWLVESIDVGTVDGSGSFVKNQTILYEYSENTVSDEHPKLTRVTRTDPSGTTIELIGEYQYSEDQETFPNALLSVSDGDGLKASFEYVSFPTTTTPVGERTEHTGSVGEYTFDGNTVTNPLGRETEYEYELVDGQYRVSTVTGVATPNCLGTTVSIGYTPNAGAPEGYIYERVERNGARTTFDRDSRGLVLTKTENADGLAPRITTYTWHATLRLPLSRTSSEMRENFSYDADGMLTSYSQTDLLPGSPTNGQVRNWTYTHSTLSSGLKVLASIDGPGLSANGVNDVVTYTYNADGTVQTATDANGLLTSYVTYDPRGNVTRIVEPDGVAWTMAYDNENRLIQVIENADASSANTISFAYDSADQITSYTDGLGRVWNFSYNLGEQLTQVENPLGETANYTYDAMSNVTKVEYADTGDTVKFFEDTAYDELGRVMNLLGSNAQTVSFTYDEEDNLKTSVDAISLVTTNSYDALNRLTQVVDRASGTTIMEHNEADQTTEFVDQRGIDTDFVYNGFGEVVQEVSADRGTISYTYDERGLVTSVTDGRGIVSNYAYDDGGRLTGKTFPTAAAENQQFTYDGTANGSEGEGKIATITDESGSIYREFADGGYINLERRTIEAEAYDTTYGFDAYGRLASTTTPGQLKIDYTYDALDRVSGITVQRQVIDPGTGQFPPATTVITGVIYEPSGPLASMTYGDSGVQTRTYDSSYRMTGLTDMIGLTALRDKSYSWTARNNLATAADALDALKTETYQYTAREFLAQATGPYDQVDYTYDAVGNRVTKAVLGQSTVTDIYAYPLTSNRLTSIAQGAGGTRTFTYDAAGNVTYDNQNGGGYGYAYNAAGRMESFSINGVVQAEYVYNALGQQTIRRLTQDGVTIHSVHDADGNRLAEYEIDNVTGARTLLQEYIWHDGVPVAVVDGATDAVFFVRTDHIGRPVFATSDTGVKVWEATYLPFGGVHSTTGSAIDLRFPGQWFQSESGLHQNWMREYDPTTGRYIQGDPLGLVAGENSFAYALNSPNSFVDPDGRNPVVNIIIQIGKRLLKRNPIQKKRLPKHKGDREIETPSKIKGMWHCKCRADFSERVEDCPPDQKPHSFGSATNKSRGLARQAAEKQAKENLGGNLVHHVSCVCRGPKGDIWRRGG